MEEENGTKKLNSTILAASFLMIRFDLVRKLAKLVGLLILIQIILLPSTAATGTAAPTAVTHLHLKIRLITVVVTTTTPTTAIEIFFMNGPSQPLLLRLQLLLLLLMLQLELLMQLLTFLKKIKYLHVLIHLCYVIAVKAVVVQFKMQLSFHTTKIMSR